MSELTVLEIPFDISLLPLKHDKHQRLLALLGLYIFSFYPGLTR